jgi:hypothetical protein
MAAKSPEPIVCPEQIGPHLTRLEGDTLCVKLIGVYSAVEALQILTIHDALHARYGRTYSLCDLSEVLPPPPETRQLIASWPFRGIYAMSAYGLTRPIRAIMQLMVAARRMLSRPALEVHAAEDEASARRWIAEHRRNVRSPVR